MSTTRGEIVETTLRALRRTLNDEDRLSVEQYVNRFYFDICRSIPIKALRRRATVDLSDSDYSFGMWLPSNMADVLRVMDVDDGFDYIERDRATIEADDSSYRHYTYIPSGDPEYYGDDLFVKQNSTTFTSEDLLVDYTGSYVKFGNEPGLYLLSAIKTFSPTYYGPNLSADNFVIRPTNTQKIVCVDPNEDALTDRSVYVDYWAMPAPLYNNSDVPLLPTTRALELMVMKEAMLIIGKRQLSSKSYNNDIDNALDELRKLCPTVAPVVRAKDVLNQTFSFDRNIFTDRE